MDYIDFTAGYSDYNYLNFFKDKSSRVVYAFAFSECCQPNSPYGCTITLVIVFLLHNKFYSRLIGLVFYLRHQVVVAPVP